MRKLIAAVLVLVLSLPAAGHARTVQLHVGQPLARIGLLRPGPQRYARYIVKADGSRSAIDIWDRRVAFEDGGKRLRLTQRWDQIAAKSVLIQESDFDARTFAPRTHVRKILRDGKWLFGGYRFARDKVIGMDDLPDNLRKDFTLAMPDPSYNFEYDMELLQSLPLALNTTFEIPFYDPGVDAHPDRYNFTVAGSDTVRGWDGKPIDCWLVTADYRTGKVVSRFWFAKKTQLLVREEAIQDDGSLLVKTLLPPEWSDASGKAARAEG